MTSHKLISTDLDMRLMELSMELAEMHDNGVLGTRSALLELADFCKFVGEEIEKDIDLYSEESSKPLEDETVAFEKMKEVVNTKYNTLDIFTVLRYGLKNPSNVGIDGIDDIYEDVIEGLYRKIEHDNKKK